MISVPNEADDIGRGPRVMILDADFPIWENCVYELPDEVPAEKKDEMLKKKRPHRQSSPRTSTKPARTTARGSPPRRQT